MSKAHKILAENLEALMRHQEAQGRRELATPVGIQGCAKKSVGKSTIYRILNQAISPRLEQLERLADVFGIPAYALLVPGLDPAKKPVVVSEQEQCERDRMIEERAEQRAAEMLNIMVGQILTRHDDRQPSETPDRASDSKVPAGRPPHKAR
jgi:transcriptional regulator with XRE-family HTH domain